MDPDLLVAIGLLILPNPTLTPGVSTPITQEKLCTTQWGKDARHVTPGMKRAVFKAYGLKGNDDPKCPCEIDHLISRELGGADVTKNLWPQPYKQVGLWNATTKDRVENRLHQEVCKGNIPLEQAQKEISTDYRIPYVRYFGTPK